jgi:hypothetical protein
MIISLEENYMRVLKGFVSILISVFVSSVLVSNIAFAHTDHALGEGSLHAIYHVAFWFAFFAVVYKGVCWFRANKKAKAHK